MAPLRVSALLSCISLSLLFQLLPILSHARLEDNQPRVRNPFQFLGPLQGCHKGQHLEGIHKLKQYLQEFGYLDRRHRGHHHPVSHSHDARDDDDFDDVLESALKTYQLNYHLNVTGVLDSETVSTMMQPRCGVADVINGTNWMRAGRQRHHHRHSSPFHFVSHYAFFPSSPRWRRTQLTYAFASGTPRAAVSAASRAFNAWASATGVFTFSQTQNYGTADMRIGFYRGDHGDGYPFDGQGGVLAHAWAPENGRFHYDADERWTTGAAPGLFDLESVALHEIGHLLGLGHSNVQGAIMWPSIQSGATKGLHSDDIQGIRALYSA